jgi:hypothetical protein
MNQFPIADPIRLRYLTNQLDTPSQQSRLEVFFISQIPGLEDPDGVYYGKTSVELSTGSVVVQNLVDSIEISIEQSSIDHQSIELTSSNHLTASWGIPSPFI